MAQTAAELLVERLSAWGVDTIFGYAKFTGRLGVCMATSGPGGVHLANGLYDAQGDDQPVLAITGHTWSHLIGTHYQQDVPLERLYSDVAAYSERVMNADHLPRVL